MMFVKIKKEAVTPGWHVFNQKQFVEVRAVANWSSADPNTPGTETTYHQKFIENKEDLDKIPELCEISIMFEDGTYVQLPVQTFKEVFIVIPSGEYSDALYGD